VAVVRILINNSAEVGIDEAAVMAQEPSVVVESELVAMPNNLGTAKNSMSRL